MNTLNMSSPLLQTTSRIRGECLIVLFGATGDLSKRKLIPALYNLIKEKRIKKFAVIGVALEDCTADEVIDAARNYIRAVDESVIQELKKLFTYVSLDVTRADDFVRLRTVVCEQEQRFNLPGNRLFFCATATHFFVPITEHLVACDLLKNIESLGQLWHRVVYEKPFGHNVESAKRINEELLALIRESQIYRIDHYLAKEVIANVAFVRFTNRIFEPLWNNQHVESVHILLSEKDSAYGRAQYYDHYGVISDVVQNHMLQLVSLIAMEVPSDLTGESIRNKKAEVLAHTRVEDAILGQYQGYLDEPGVRPDSKTPTFAMLKLAINNWRWIGVPFYLKAGKCLETKETTVYIQFKKVPCLLPRNCPVGSNGLTIKIFPEGELSLEVNVKTPGVTDAVMPVDMTFCHSCLFGPYSMEAYEMILEEVIAGDQSVSVRADEIEYSWRIVDVLNSMNLPVYSYVPGSDGPKELEIFTQRYGVIWQW